MNPGLTTFHHLVNDTLMPWLLPYSNEKLMRKVIQHLMSDSLKPDSNFFRELPIALKKSGIQTVGPVLKDWHELAALPDEKKLTSGQIVGDQKWERPSVAFFLTLSCQCADKHLNWLELMMNRNNNNHIKKRYVMRSLMDIGHLIIDGGKEYQVDTDKLTIMEDIIGILAFVWITIYNNYVSLVSHTALPLLLKEVIDRQSETSILFCEGKNSLQSYVSKTMQVVDTAISSDENKLSNSEEKITELITDIKADMSSLKENIVHLTDTTTVVKNKSDSYIRGTVVCQLLGISKSTLNNWRKKGKFSDIKKVVNRYEYNKIEIMKFKKQ